MTIFEAVKAEVTPRIAAERYGLNVSRASPYRGDAAAGDPAGSEKAWAV